MLGSNLIQIAIKLTAGQTIKDQTSGMRSFNARMIEQMARGLNFGPEPDMVCIYEPESESTPDPLLSGFPFRHDDRKRGRGARWERHLPSTRPSSVQHSVIGLPVEMM